MADLDEIHRRDGLIDVADVIFLVGRFRRLIPYLDRIGTTRNLDDRGMTEGS